MAVVKAEGDVRSEMIDWIRRNYGEMLGKDADRLDKPGGLDFVQRKYCSQFIGRLRKAA